MNFAKRILMFVGFVVLAAALVSVLAPKATHGLVATLVQVTNTPANPVPTVATDNPALRPYGKYLTIFPGQTSASFQVPAGQTLVIEQLHYTCLGPLPSGFVPAFFVSLTTGGTPLAFNFNGETYSLLGENVGNFDQVVHLYADPASQVTVYQTYPIPASYAGGNSGCGVSISGHLVNAL